jgi:hypothetical protein
VYIDNEYRRQIAVERAEELAREVRRARGPHGGERPERRAPSRGVLALLGRLRQQGEGEPAYRA